jgi:mRNA interferase HicA
MRGCEMRRTFTAIITRDGPWWIGWIKEIPGVNCQERTKEDLLLKKHDCELLRKGKRHSWWWNPTLKRRFSVPRHTEISNQLAKKICKDLGIPQI